MEQLDNPIWYALTTRQAHLAEGDGGVVRFVPAISPLAALRDPTEAQALAALMRPGEVAGLFVDAPIALPPPLEITHDAELVQMVHEAPPPNAPDGVVELGAGDIDEMVALAEVTKPGPFGPRTAELGLFLGVRDDGRLVAMAGQRLRLEGIVEVSAVCTHPDATGRGLGARLMDAQLARIYAGVNVPALHVRASNARAIALYERGGFRERRRFHYLVVESRA